MSAARWRHAGNTSANLFLEELRSTKKSAPATAAQSGKIEHYRNTTTATVAAAAATADAAANVDVAIVVVSSASHGPG